MSKKRFMVDIETTGVDQEKSEILQVAFVEMIWRNQRWEPGKQLSFFQHSDAQPNDPFARKHMKEIYACANRAVGMSSEQCRTLINTFFKDCGCEGAENVYLCGNNAMNFDVPFLVRDKYLVRSSYDENDKMIGDFHYRVYEMSGAFQFAEDMTGLDRKEIKARVEKIAPVNEEQEHDALYDCFYQIDVLNALKKVVEEVVIANYEEDGYY